jgi:hypothetical protein
VTGGEDRGALFWTLVLLSIAVVVLPPPGDEYLLLPAIWGWYYVTKGNQR